jgi:hypothetical protein
MWGLKWGQMIWGATGVAVPAVSGVALLLLSVLLLVVGYRMGKRQRAPRWLPWLTGIGAALLPVAVVRATTFTVPVIFSNGTVAHATQVNTDLSTIAAEIDRLRKQTAVVTDCEFRPRDGNVGYGCLEGQSGANITDGTAGGMVGPVNVPQGATITSIDIWVNDSSSTANVALCLWAPFDSFGSNDLSIPCVKTSGTPGIVKLTITTNVVQGNGEAFELLARSLDSSGNDVGWPASAGLTVRTAYVHYEMP